MAKASLHSAYVWDCDNCGKENFARAVSSDLDDDEREEAYRHFNDLEPWAELPEHWRDFEIVTYPMKVTCHNCGTAYDTESDRE